MKFFVLLAFGIVFLTVFTRADDESEEESEEEEDEDDDSPPQALSSAMQLTGNNVGDINNIKGKIYSRVGEKDSLIKKLQHWLQLIGTASCTTRWI